MTRTGEFLQRFKRREKIVQQQSVDVPIRRSVTSELNHETTRALELAMPSAVSIGTLVTDEFGAIKGVGIGEGFIVGENLVATNRHVVANAAEIQVQSSNMGPGGEYRQRTVFPAQVLFENPEHDVALIGIDTSHHPEVQLPAMELGSDSDIHFGHRVMTIGSPYAMSDSFSEGRVTRLDSIPQSTPFGEENFIQISAPVDPGNSGGMVFNPETNKVIGIVDAQAGGESRGLMITVDIVRDTIKQFQEQSQSQLEVPVSAYPGYLPAA